MHHPSRVEDIAWDPGEWHWGTAGQPAKTHFFDYTTKQGYKQGVDKRTIPTKYEKRLQTQGHTQQERKDIYGRMWHQWLLCKVNTFLQKDSHWGVG